MNNIINEFGKYMLSDCKNCCENKGGLCTSKTRCFAAKNMAIEALRMLNDKIEREPKLEYDVLKTVMDDCHKRPGCENCEYLNNDTHRCRLAGTPWEWEFE